MKFDPSTLQKTEMNGPYKGNNNQSTVAMYYLVLLCTAMASLQYFFGDKYYLIQLHRQIAQIFKKNCLISSSPAISIQN